MKKSVIIGLVVFLCSPLAVYAASIGDAETQGRFKFGIDLDIEYMFKRDMEFKSASFDLPPGLDITNAEIKNMFRPMIRGSFGIFDFLDVYVKLGAAQYEGEMEWEVMGITWISDKIETEWGFAYGGGLKGAYTFENGFLIGADLQYLAHKQDGEDTERDEIFGGEVEFDVETTLQEWHFAPYVGMKFGNFTPYLGGKYSDVRVKIKDEFGDWLKFEADKNIGAFAGISYKIGERFKINLEGRFIDERAVTVGLAYRF